MRCGDSEAVVDDGSRLGGETPDEGRFTAFSRRCQKKFGFSGSYSASVK